MDGLVRAKVALNDANFWYDMECRLEKLCSRFYKYVKVKNHARH